MKKQIQIKQDAALILSWLIVHYWDYQEYPRSKGNLCEWTGLDEKRVVDASVYLCKNGFARMRGIHLETDPDGDGKAWLLGLRDNPHFQISILWTDEALSGITTGGKETKIENAVVQNFGHVSNPKLPDDKIIKMIAAAKMKKRSEDLPGNVELRICKGFGIGEHIFEAEKEDRRRGYCPHCRYLHEKSQSSSQSE
jgi:hypothetical protein